MLLLEALALLKLRLMTETEVSTVIDTVKSEEEFHERIEEKAGYDKVTFVTEWSSLGVNKLAHEIWCELILTYYRGHVVSTIQSATEVKRRTIESHEGLILEVVTRASENIALTPLTFGKNIEKIIKNNVRTIFNNNSKIYKALLIGRDNDEDINPTVMDIDKTYYNKVTDLTEALRNVPADEVRTLLFDISASNTVYKMDTSRSTKFEYSIYESFLRALFRLRMQGFNERYKSIVSVTMLEHLDNKYEKFDFVMYGLLEDFVMPGISKDNINQFLNALYIQVKMNKATSAAPLFSLDEVSSVDFACGNFRTDRRLSKQSAGLNFNLVARAFLALSKLYGYLVSAGVSPFSINPRVFEVSYGSASNRFISLEELVNHSNDVVKIKEQYDIPTSLVGLNALKSKDEVEGSILPSYSQQIILDNRQKLNLSEVSKYFSTFLGNPNTLAGYQGLSVSTIHFTDQNGVLQTEEDREIVYPCCNLLEFVDYIRLEKNPLYTLRLSTNDLLDDDFWDLEYLDLSVMSSFFSEVLNKDAASVCDIYDSISSLRNLVRGTGSAMDNLIADLDLNDMGVTAAIISSIRKFAEDFISDTYNLMNPSDDINRSHTEYYAYLLGLPLLEPLHKLIDITKPSRSTIIEEAICAVVNVYEEFITLEDVKQFLNTSQYKLISFKSFVFWVRNTLFKDLVSLVQDANAQLSGLSDVGSRVELTGEALENALMGTNPLSEVSMEQFREQTKNVGHNTEGYLVDENGDIYSLVCVNNKYGALYSNGYYVFNDGTTIPWNKVGS